MARKKTARGAASREMAAVMFTDVRGYSMLTQKDEALAVRLLDVKRELADLLIAKHHGRLVKTIGDALMVEFKSALSAVRCAAELQKQLHAHNATAPQKERLLVRVGVHLGDVIRKGEDILGDTVNIAARVEPQAQAGGIAITQAIYDQIKGKLELPLDPLGNVKLKGIDGEIPLFSVRLPWADGPAVRPASGPGFVVRLKQHHMFRIASLYATGAYVLILVSNAIFPDLGFTREDVRYVIGTLALAFPLVLTGSWMFISPSRENPERLTRWKRLRFRLGTAISLVVIGFVAVSGVFLWRLDARHSAETHPTVAASVAVLPFDHLGEVDPSLSSGIQATMETTLDNVGSIRVISHNAITADPGAKRSNLDLARTAGAAYVIQGSIQRPDTRSAYTMHADLVSVTDGATVFSVSDTYAPGAQLVGIEQQIASRLAGPVRFLSRPDDWLAEGYPTTKNPRALQLLRQAMMADYYDGTATPSTLVREALDLDPGFAQAHAYLAYYMTYEDNSGNVMKAAQSEVERAETLVPDLPEAHLARGMLAWLAGDDKAALQEFGSVEAKFPKNFLLHYTFGRELSYAGRDDDAEKEMEAAQAIDPFQASTAPYIARIHYFDRDYEFADRMLAADQANWPLEALTRLWRAQVAFAYHGDVAAYAKVINGDWSAYIVDDTWLEARRIEAAHLEGRHQDVLKMLRVYPQQRLQSTRFYNTLARWLVRDNFTVETLRLLGRDKEAAQQAALALPAALDQAARTKDTVYILNLAQLQALGGNSAAALKTVAPIVAQFHSPQIQWGIDEAAFLVDTAIVLAWSGDKAGALELLQKSFSLPHGAHAAIVAHDPVWRPLYSEPGFKALLAAHGQALAYAK